MSDPVDTMRDMVSSMLGRGLYDVSEVGRLLGHDPEWVIRWSTDARSGPAVTEPTFDRMFSFADLISLKVASVVRERGISDRHLRRGVEVLRDWTRHDRPLAARDVIASLATSGDSFLSDLNGDAFEDIGRGGQGVFQDVVRVHLERVQFDRHGDPERWIPSQGVVIDPTIQAGAPCIEGTRILTATVASLLTNADPADVAFDFDVPVRAIVAAARFERKLVSGAGLAA